MLLLDIIVFVGFIEIFMALDALELSCHELVIIDLDCGLGMQTSKLTDWEKFLINVSDNFEWLGDEKQYTNSDKIRDGSGIVKACLVSAALLWCQLELLLAN